MKLKINIGKNDYWVFVVILLFVGLFIWGLISIGVSENKSYNFYNETCNTLNATYLKGYSMCYRVVDNVLTYYNIEQINDSYYLRANTQFMGVGRK